MANDMGKDLKDLLGKLETSQICLSDRLHDNDTCSTWLKVKHNTITIFIPHLKDVIRQLEFIQHNMELDGEEE